MPETRNDLATSLAGINSKLATLTTEQSSLSKKFDDKTAELMESMDAKINKLKTDITTELTGKIEGNTVKIEENTERLDDLERKYEELENDLEFVERSADLIVRGIPLTKDEKLDNYFRDIAKAIDPQQTTLPRVRIFRMGRKKPGSKTDPPILIRFASRIDRSEFFHAYLQNTNLKLSDIGFSVDTRIFLSDNLTTMNRRIFQAAMKLKADGKIFSAKTISGKVYIRKMEADLPIRISHISELPSAS
jgi:hypothetical protein